MANRWTGRKRGGRPSRVGPKKIRLEYDNISFGHRSGSYCPALRAVGETRRRIDPRAEDDPALLAYTLEVGDKLRLAVVRSEVEEVDTRDEPHLAAWAVAQH